MPGRADQADVGAHSPERQDRGAHEPPVEVVGGGAPPPLLPELLELEELVLEPPPLELGPFTYTYCTPAGSAG
jgi:hypothetical protein